MSAPFVFEQLEATGDVVAETTTPVDRAAAIVAEAEARAHEIEEAARRSGYEAGFAEGAAAAAEEARRSLDGIAAAVDAVAAARADAVAALELQAAELAVLVAERVLSTTIELRPEVLRDVVASALRRIDDAERLVLDVNPEDASDIRAWFESDERARFERLEVRPERRVPPGGCVVRSAEVEIDARIETQLERVRDLVREALGTTG